MKSFAPSLALLIAAVLYIGIGATGCGSAKAESTAVKTVEIQTSANCGMCKTTIEGALKGTEGVSSCRLDLGNKKVTVEYDENVVSEDGIRKAITSSGYDADDLVCDKAAHDELPACCQKGAAAH